MILSKVEYDCFNWEEVSPLMTELHRRVRLVFSDAPALCVSWTWKQRPGDEDYSIAYREESASDRAGDAGDDRDPGEAGEAGGDDCNRTITVDASSAPFWDRLIGREVIIEHIDPDRFILEVRSDDVRTYLSSWAIDTVTVSHDDPRLTSRLIVITGGPGSGKTTLIDALAREGYRTVTAEAGRAIIRDQVTIGGSALPWADKRLFADLMLSWEMRSHREACDRARRKDEAGDVGGVGGVDAAVFFDRGVPDVIGYLHVIGLSVPPYMDRAARLIRYAPRVFIAPPWPAIYSQDTERKQTLEEAGLTYKAMVDTYEAYGYEVVTLPKVTVDERVRFVLDRTSLRTVWPKPKP